MDRREEMTRVVKSLQLVPEEYKVFYYPDIPNERKTKISRHFDSNINYEAIIVFIDTTVMNSAKNGMVFTDSGIYCRQMLEKTFYFNYADIVDIRITADKKGRITSTDASLEIILKKGENYQIGYGYYYKSNLKEILLKLKEEYLKNEDQSCRRISGEVGKLQLTEEQKEKCGEIIHTASVAAGAAAITPLSQIPLSDNAVIMPIQITMIVSLGKVFRIEVTESLAKSIIGSATASIVGRSASQLLVGWIPFLGNTINTATAAGVTETIGWLAVSNFFERQQYEMNKYRVENKNEGYVAASREYEIKLRKQAEMFFRERETFRVILKKSRQEQELYKNSVENYKKLLLDYEKYIKKLEMESGDKNAKVEAWKREYQELRDLGN